LRLLGRVFLKSVYFMTLFFKSLPGKIAFGAWEGSFLQYAAGWEK